ncbi:MAG: cation:proton antiporter [Acidobacteria bacterium]|nr:cation:proton antiporter [Acidobacteriota bacterium]
MIQIELLGDLVIILAVAVVVVTLLHRLRVPSIAGFIVVGLLIGPNALGFIRDVHQIELLAEVGVVLLLFGIGLELSLERVRQLWRYVLLGGAVQVGLTILVTAGLAVQFGATWPVAVFMGFIVAVSSTAIVLRGLAVRGELETPHGRLVLGILIFQDLAVVPMMLVVPVLAGSGASLGQTAAALGIALAVLVGILVAAGVVVPRLLEIISRTRQRDLFVLGVFTICLGTAWLVSLAGISLALGAFLAGLVVAGSEYRHQALADLIPLREILASIFFVSIGMLLDVGAIGQNILAILGLLAAIIVGKFILVSLAAALLRLPLRISLLTGLILAQVGEFSFVLFKAAAKQNLLPSPLDDNLLVAVILSMVITPLLIVAAPHLSYNLGKIPWLKRRLRLPTTDDADAEKSWRNHVIIAGYGLAGQELATTLQQRAVPFLVVDLNPANIRLAAGRNQPVYFGDIAQADVEEHIGLARARLLVVAINDTRAVVRAVRLAHQAAPGVPIFARTTYLQDVDRIRRAGAAQVVCAEVESAARLNELLLDHLCVSDDECRDRLTDIRTQVASG